MVALNQEALANLEKEEYEKAVALFRKVTEREPQMGLPYLNLGLALVKAGKHEEAIENLQKALELDFDFPEVHRYLAQEYKLLGKLEESKKERAVYLRMKEEQQKKKAEKLPRGAGSRGNDGR